MNNIERMNLQKMITANDVEDNTSKIRKLKHSKLILKDVDTLLKLKKDNPRLSKTNSEAFDKLCTSRCQFLFNNYTDIYNKVKKDEIQLPILLQLLNVLYAIEEGNVDQHEGSFEVGKLLKKIYIDSALTKADRIDKKNSKKQDKRLPDKKISWEEFKKKQLIENK